MGEGKLKIDIRRKNIAEMLKKCGRAGVTELSRTLGVTPVTIRTDLDALEADGVIERVTGGAIYRGKDYASTREGVSFLEEKRAIAGALFEMISDGDTLFINSGSTTAIAAELLSKRSGLNIVTNSVAVAEALRDATSHRVIMLGGELNVKYGFTYGADAEERLSRYHANWAILSVDGIGAESGITTYHAEEAVVDRTMMRSATRTVVLAHSSKIGRTGFMRVGNLKEGTTVITNRCDSREMINALREIGTEVIEV